MARDQGGVAFMRRMEQARANARVARNTGRHVGASAKGWDYKRPELDRDNWHDVVRVTLTEWQSAVLNARNDFSAACLNGRNWEEELNAIPF